MNYDAKTENGIPYFSGLYKRSFEYLTVVDSLNDLAVQRKAILAGGAVNSYTIGNRSITRNQLSPSELLKLWDRLMAKKLSLENGRKPRKAVGVVHRDW
ncbi:MAG: hypothetical protein IJT16_11540 [Lachnospiraceae bacterium]|nr:hypothetical protein [Lachnospiraceae bacterium]